MDMHFTAAGHEVVAAALADELAGRADLVAR